MFLQFIMLSQRPRRCAATLNRAAKGLRRVDLGSMELDLDSREKVSPINKNARVPDRGTRAFELKPRNIPGMLSIPVRRCIQIA